MKIYELRRNPDKNKKNHIISEIEPYYRSGKEYYLHFSDVNQLTINPQSTHDTPLGIYGYPLNDAIWRDLVQDTIPFASRRKYIVLFEASGNILDGANYDNESLKSDVAKIEKIFRKTFVSMFKNHKNQVFNKVLYHGNELDKKPNVMLHSYDKPNNDFYSSPDNKVKMKRAVKNIKDDPEKNDILGDLKSNNYKKFVVDILSLWQEEFYSPHPVKKLWDILSNLSSVDTSWRRKESGFPKQLNNSSYAVWNRIIRQLGYDGVVDSKGYGFIYKHEPYQAVFVNPKAVKIVEVFQNTLRSLKTKDGKIEISDIHSVIQFINIGRMETRDKRYAILLGQFLDLIRNGESKNFYYKEKSGNGGLGHIMMVLAGNEFFLNNVEKYIDLVDNLSHGYDEVRSWYSFICRKAEEKYQGGHLKHIQVLHIFDFLKKRAEEIYDIEDMLDDTIERLMKRM